MKIVQGLFLRGGPHYLCGKREESAIASHGHGKGGSHEVIHVEDNPDDNGSSGENGDENLDENGWESYDEVKFINQFQVSWRNLTCDDDDNHDGASHGHTIWAG